MLVEFETLSSENDSLDTFVVSCPLLNVRITFCPDMRSAWFLISHRWHAHSRGYLRRLEHQAHRKRFKHRVPFQKLLLFLQIWRKKSHNVAADVFASTWFNAEACEETDWSWNSTSFVVAEVRQTNRTHWLLVQMLHIPTLSCWSRMKCTDNTQL